MNFLSFNLFDLLILLFALDWLLKNSNTPKNQLDGFLHRLCNPLNELLAAKMQLRIHKWQLPPEAQSILILILVRLTVSALY